MDAVQMFSIESIEDASEFTNTIIYGPFGHGKSYLAGTACLIEDMQDVLYISFEKGDKALRAFKNSKHISVVKPKSYKQMATIYGYLLKHLEARDAGNTHFLRIQHAVFNMQMDQNVVIAMSEEELAKLIPVPFTIRCVVIDSLTEAHKFVLYMLTGVDPATTELDAIPEQKTWGTWGDGREMIQFLIRQFRDLPIHNIYLVSCELGSNNLKQTTYDLQLSGQLQSDVLGMVDNVGLIIAGTNDGGEVIRELHFAPGATHKAKNRFENYDGRAVMNPTWASIFALDDGTNTSNRKA